MTRDDGSTLALVAAGAVAAVAALARPRDGSRSAYSEAFDASFRALPVAAGAFFTPTPGARVAAGAMLALPAIYAFGRAKVREYLSLEVDGQVKMIKSQIRFGMPGAGLLKLLMRDPDRAKKIASELDRFLRDHAEETVESAMIIAEAAVVAKTAKAGGPFGSRAVSSGVESLVELLAALQALRWFYHSTHWTVKGQSFYGDHLLFERLYGGAAPALDAEIDGLGEKMVAAYGSDVVQVSSTWPKAGPFLEEGARSSTCPYQQALTMERRVQAIIRSAYDALKAAGELSLGLDDMLMTLANERETAIYLLQQRASRG